MSSAAPASASEPAKRASFSREKKVNVLAWFDKTGQNASATAKQFCRASKRVREWRKAGADIMKMLVGSRTTGFGRTSFFSAMAKRLHDEFRQQRAEGKNTAMVVCYSSQSPCIMAEMDPGAASSFKFS